MIEISIEDNNTEIPAMLEGEEQSLSAEVGEVQKVSTNNYNDLLNKPKINGTELIGNYNETDPTVPQWAKADQKPTYTAEEVNAVNENNAISIAEIEQMWNSL